MRILDKKQIEKELVAACLKGNSSGQRELYHRYSRKMMGITVRYIQETESAEDVLVRAFTRVFDRLDTFRFEGSLEGWIRKIVINEALGQLRSEGASKWSVSLEEIKREPACDADIYDRLSTEELLEHIRSLPLGYRTVFNLFAIEGFTHKEIARKLNIGIGTSKSQYLRARVLLQKKIRISEDPPKSMEYGS
jgi:RNA polymerase sigma-70 factor, ECF subfamily